MGIAAATFIWVFVLTGIADKRSANLQQQAVEHGYAEWRLTHSHNGETEFRWLDNPVPPPASDKQPKPSLGDPEGLR